jgi:ribosomal protein S7
MSRKHRAQTRQVLPDPSHDDIVVTKFINGLMLVVKNQQLRRSFTEPLRLKTKGGEEGIKFSKKL